MSVICNNNKNVETPKWERERKKSATSHARGHSHRCRLPLQQFQPLAPTTPAESGRSRRRRGSPMMPALPHRSSSNLPTLHLPIHSRRHLLPPAAAPAAAGGVRACSTERLHGLGSSSSFGGGCARPAASSNDLIAQAQIVPSSRLEFAPIPFPPSQPKLPIDALLFLF